MYDKDLLRTATPQELKLLSMHLGQRLSERLKRINFNSSVLVRGGKTTRIDVDEAKQMEERRSLVVCEKVLERVFPKEYIGELASYLRRLRNQVDTWVDLSETDPSAATQMPEPLGMTPEEFERAARKQLCLLEPVRRAQLEESLRFELEDQCGRIQKAKTVNKESKEVLSANDLRQRAQDAMQCAEEKNRRQQEQFLDRIEQALEVQDPGPNTEQVRSEDEVMKSGQSAATGLAPVADGGEGRQSESEQETGQYQFDVALSFAGEDRSYARELADMLRARNITVFYDEYQKGVLWGKDLYQFLQEIYRDKARYCVPFLSLNYANKVWTKHELKQAQARAIGADEEYILPVRLDDTEIPGLNHTTGYLDLRQSSMQETADLLEEKLKAGGHIPK